MKKYAIILSTLLALLLVASPILANNQGFESSDANKAGKDYFFPNQNVYVKETKILPGGDCGDPNDIISVYIVNHKNWTADGRFPYYDGASLAGYVKKVQLTINNDRSIFWNLGTFQPGFYDIVQGGSDYRGADLYQGGCLDQLGSPFRGAGFDVLAVGECRIDSDCTQGSACVGADETQLKKGKCTETSPPPGGCTPDWQLGSYSGMACWYDANSCNVTAGKPTDGPLCKDLGGQWCTPQWLCNEWSSCVNGTQTRQCNDVNKCGVNLSKPEEMQACLSERCLSVLTPAYNPETKECKVFQTSCIDEGWIKGECPYTGGGGNGGGGDGGEKPPKPPVSGCVENWACENWSDCINRAQTRDCKDANICGTALKKPISTRTCEIKITDDNETIIINPPPGVTAVFSNLWMIALLLVVIIILIGALVVLAVHISSSKKEFAD